MIHPDYSALSERQAQLLTQPNQPTAGEAGILQRWVNPVLTRDHIPLTWIYDLDQDNNPFFLPRLGINSVFNSGAIKIDGRYYLVARVEGYDRKSFFALASSERPTEGFVFDDYPITLPDVVRAEVDV